MGIKDVRRYIEKLHKKQDNPYLWPDYLTGLPDSKATVKKVSEVLPKLGKYSICYLRIANIEPYLMKYGYDNHVDIIQWSAAILKTVADEMKKTFVGRVSTHEFVVITERSKVASFLTKSNSLLKRRFKDWYSESDIKRGYIFSFKDANEKERKVGLLRFVCAYVDRPLDIEKIELLPTLRSLCRLAEAKGKTRLTCT